MVNTKIVLTENIEKAGEKIGKPRDTNITYLKFFKDGILVHELHYNGAKDCKPNSYGEFEVGILKNMQYDYVDIYLIGYLPELFIQRDLDLTEILYPTRAIKSRLMPYRFKYTMSMKNVNELRMAFPPVLPPKNKRNDYKDIEGSYQFTVEKRCGCNAIIECPDVDVSSHGIATTGATSET